MLAKIGSIGNIGNLDHFAPIIMPYIIIRSEPQVRS